MRLSLLVLASSLSLSILPMVARADQFTITGTNTITFNLPASPTPASFVSTLGFTIQNVSVTENNNAPVTEDVLFFEDGIAIAPQTSIGFDPGFGFDVTANNAIAYDFTTIPNSIFGKIAYKGGEATPTFLTGTYGLDDNLNNGDLTLTISAGPAVSATPEPSSILMLGTGLLGVAGVLKRRFV